MILTSDFFLFQIRTPFASRSSRGLDGGLGHRLSLPERRGPPGSACDCVLRQMVPRPEHRPWEGNARKLYIASENTNFSLLFRPCYILLSYWIPSLKETMSSRTSTRWHPQTTIHRCTGCVRFTVYCLTSELLSLDL